MKTETISRPAGPLPAVATGPQPTPARCPPPRVERPFEWSVLPLALLALAGIALHLLLRFVFHAPRQALLAPLYLVLLAGGVPLLFGLVRKLVQRQFGSDLLAGISILTAVLEGEYLVGSIVVLMLSGGAALEQLAARRASSVLDALARRMPHVAHRKVDSGMRDIKLDDVAIGDLLIILPYEICPADGVVVEGQGTMNEAFLTGEPFEVSKAPGAQVISGALNGEAALIIRTERLPVDSRYARIMRVMEETQQRRPALRRLGDQLGAWYTPVALAVALAAWAITRESHRFLAVLVIATPCPLLIAIPVAIIGAISLAARGGIIIKDPAALERINLCKIFIFDKTGTLTYARPSLTEIECAPGFQEQDVLRAAASLEPYSKHPLARAILDASAGANLPLDAPSEVHEPPGEGLRGIVAGRTVLLTGRNRVRDPAIQLPPIRSGLECLVFIDGVFAAAFRFHDEPRKEARGFLRHLGPRHRVEKILIVSGDRPPEVQFLAREVGITHVHAAKTPEEKVEIVREEMKRGKVLFVGDGINDAPAMQAATVGVAFGQRSDIAAEAADAVVLESSLTKVDELIHIGRRMRSIALQSSVGGMALSVVGMFAAAAGYLPPIAGAITQEVIDLLAVLNAVRVVLPFEHLRDF
jgi:heavy metal translocating P-type ATPase